jgi:hypothetical protein
VNTEQPKEARASSAKEARASSAKERPLEINAEEVLAAAGTRSVFQMGNSTDSAADTTHSEPADRAATGPLELKVGERQLYIEIHPEPSEEELAAIAAAIVALVGSMKSSRPAALSLQSSSAMRAAAWKAARRARPTPHLIRGVEPGIAWKLSGLLGKPYGR